MDLQGRLRDKPHPCAPFHPYSLFEVVAGENARTAVDEDHGRYRAGIEEAADAKRRLRVCIGQHRPAATVRKHQVQPCTTPDLRRTT